MKTEKFGFIFLGVIMRITLVTQVHDMEPKIVEPPDNQTVAVNSVAKFICRTTSFVVWQINSVQLSSDSREAFHKRGIRTENESVLLVNASLDNEGVNIACLTGPDRTRLDVKSTIAVLAVFDRPNPPSNLTLLYVDHLTISWIPPFTLPRVTLSYFVNVTNLNTHQVFGSGELSKPSFNFSGTEDNSPCDVYQFTVTARNAAGWSDPSDTFNASTPSVPSNVSDVNHSVKMSGEEALIKITFQAARACSKYPVTYYNLNIRSSDVNQSAVVLGPYTSNGASQVEITLNSSDGIDQNARYNFHISAFNIIGSSNSSEMEFYTTDVQYAQVEYDSQTVVVTCHFAEGSKALGCHVQLNSSNDSLVFNISRGDGTLIAQQEIKTQLPPHCYQFQLYVYDWEADGTVGTLLINPVETMFADRASKACETATVTFTPGTINTDSPKSNTSLVGIIFGVVSGALAVMVLIIIVVVVVVMCAKKAQVAQRNTVENDSLSEKDNHIYSDLEPSSPSQQTPEIPLYDIPMTPTKLSGVGGECEKEYSTLLHSCESPKPSVAPQADDVGHYSQLNTFSQYAVLEKDSAPMPISTSARSSASSTPPSSLPPPSSPSPPPTSSPPPSSLPPLSSSPPPLSLSPPPTSPPTPPSPSLPPLPTSSSPPSSLPPLPSSPPPLHLSPPPTSPTPPPSPSLPPLPTSPPPPPPSPYIFPLPSSPPPPPPPSSLPPPSPSQPPPVYSEIQGLPQSALSSGEP